MPLIHILLLSSFYRILTIYLQFLWFHFLRRIFFPLLYQLFGLNERLTEINCKKINKITNEDTLFIILNNFQKKKNIQNYKFCNLTEKYCFSLGMPSFGSQKQQRGGQRIIFEILIQKTKYFSINAINLIFFTLFE